MRHTNQSKTLFILLAAWAVVLTFPSEGISENVKLRVTVERANIRLKPSLESTIVSRAPLGAVFENAEKTGEWYKISLPPDEGGFVVTGYIHSSIVDVLTEPMPRENERTADVSSEEMSSPPRRTSLPPPPAGEMTRSEEQRRPPRYDEPPASSGFGVGLKLSGGMNYLFLGDVNDAYEGKNAYIQGKAVPGSITGEYPAFHTGWDFNGELILNFSRSFGIGVGGGYIMMNSNSGDVSWREPLPPITLNYKESQDLEVTAVPIRLSLHVTIPLGAVNLAFHAGGDYYLGKFSQVFKWEDWFSTGETQVNGTMSTIGGHAGMGFEINFSRNFAFVLEAEGRYAKFSGIEGDWETSGVNWFGPFSDSGKKTLYYYDANGTNPVLIWADDMPAVTPLVQNPREGTVDFSGIFFGGGFKIRF